MKKTNNIKHIISLVVSVMSIVLVVGLVVALGQGVLEKLGIDSTGGGAPADTTTNKNGDSTDGTSAPDDTSTELCSHTWVNGFCSKCSIPLPNLTAPVISASGATVEWNTVSGAEGYMIFVNGAHVETIPSRKYTVTAPSGGDVTVTVKAAVGNVISEASNAVTIKLLAAPTISLSRHTLTWNAVTNANQYHFYKQDEYGVWTKAFTITDSSRSVDLMERLAASVEDGASVKIAVTAYDSSLDYVESSMSNIVTWTKIVHSVTSSLTSGSFVGIPDTTVRDGGTWTATIAPHTDHTLPESITVTMNGATLTAGVGYTYNSTTGAISIPNITGAIKIAATFPWVTYDAPANLSVNGNILSWSAVSGADEYYIRIYGDLVNDPNPYDQRFVSTTNSFDLSQCNLTKSELLTIVVWVPVGDGTSGNASSITWNYVKTLDTPVLTKNGSTITWASISGATGYEVFVGGVSMGTMTATSYTHSTSIAGTYIIGVRAVNSESVSSVRTTTLTYYPAIFDVTRGRILGGAHVALEGQDYSCVLVKDSSSFTRPDSITVRIGGITLTSGYTYNKSTGEIVIDGAMVTGRINIDAEILGLDTPNVTVNGMTFTWDPVDDATHYYIYINEDVNSQIRVNGTSWTFTETTPGEYIIYVTAANATVESDISVHYLTVTAQSLAAPTGISFDSSNNMLYWNAVPGAIRYSIYAYEADGSHYSYQSTTTSCELWLIAEGEADHRYVTVRAWNGDIYSEESDPYYLN